MDRVDSEVEGSVGERRVPTRTCSESMAGRIAPVWLVAGGVVYGSPRIGVEI